MILMKDAQLLMVHVFIQELCPFKEERLQIKLETKQK